MTNVLVMCMLISNLLRDPKNKVLPFYFVTQVDLQDVPPVLELARNDTCSCPVQVRPQTGLPVWPVPALRACHPALRETVLPVNRPVQRLNPTQEGSNLPLSFLFLFVF